MPDRKKKTTQWKKFTEQTTLHGFRYIFIGRKCSVRRVVWGFLVVTAIGLFGAQVFLRTRDYLLQRNNVFEQKLTVDDLDFPIVTICNNNPYRATVAIEHGLYNTLHEIYNHPNRAGLTPDAVLDKINMTAFVSEAAHQKHDLIRRCSWKGTACDVDLQFRTKIIEDRLCYQFNTEDNREKTLDPGIRNGLSLLMNVEQYEYIPGVHNDAGIKLFLTNTDEGHGDRTAVSITPGHHAMAILNPLKIEEPTTLGIGCSSDEEKLYFTCLSECRLNLIQKKCGCAPPSLGEKPNAKTCNASALFGCVRATRDIFSKEGDSCDCSYPCSRITYKTTVSHSDISNQNIQRMILDHETNDDAAEILQRAFVRAREASQSAIPSIATRDKRAALNVINEFKDYLKNINHTLLKLRNNAALLTGNGIIHFSDISKAVTDDILSVVIEYAAQKRIADSVVLNYESTLEVHRDSMIDFYGYNKTSSPLLQKLLLCYNKSGASLEACDSRKFFWDEKRKQARRLSTSTYLYELAMDKTLKDYESVVQQLFINTTSLLLQIPQHSECVASIALLNNTLKKSINFASAYSKANSFRAKYNVIRKAFNHTNIIVDFERNLYSAKSCEWYSKGWGDFKINIDDKIQELSKLLSKASGSLKRLEEKFSDMLTEYHKEVSILLDTLTLFIEKKESKINVSELFDALTTRKLISDIEGHVFELSTLFYKFQNDIAVYENHINEILRIVFNFKVPIIRSNILWSMELIELSRITKGSDLSELFNSYDKVGSSFLERLIKDFVNEFGDFLKSSVQKQISLCYDVLKAISRVQKLMEDYTSGTKINNKFFKDNFVKVDVFYNDLTYTRKTQQPVFGLLSLLSEIGGFSALMIGASILTVIEFIDILIVYLIRLCCGGRDPDYEEAETNDAGQQHTTPATPRRANEKQHVYAVPDTDEIYTSLPHSNPPYHRGVDGGFTGHPSPFTHKPQVSFQSHRQAPQQVAIPVPDVRSQFDHQGQHQQNILHQQQIQQQQQQQFQHHTPQHRGPMRTRLQ